MCELLTPYSSAHKPVSRVGGAHEVRWACGGPPSKGVHGIIVAWLVVGGEVVDGFSGCGAGRWIGRNIHEVRGLRNSLSRVITMRGDGWR